MKIKKKKIALSQLNTESIATIENISNDLKNKPRFSEMGIIPGKNLKHSKIFTLHLFIKIMGSTIMIRKETADQIFVSEIYDGKKPTIALIGNPNSGKTAVFNQLTGLAQKVSNYQA